MFLRSAMALSRRSLPDHVRLFLAVASAYVLLSGFYGVMGYLANPQARIAPTDSAFYYMWVRSALFDRDIDFTNEIAHYIGQQELGPNTTALGRQGNVHSLGPGLFWAPAVALAHGVSLTANALGASLPTDGFGGLYHAFVWAANSLYALLGFYFMGRVLLRFMSLGAAVFASMAVLLASQMTYYLWPLLPMAHNTAFLCVALFLHLLLSRGVCWQAALCGSLVFLTRWQDVIYLTPMAVMSLDELRRQRELKPWLKRNAALAAVFLLGVSPQLLAWKHLYGSYVTVPHGSGYMDLGRMEFFNILFSLRRGLLLWHPILALGFVGLAFLWKKDQLLCWSLSLALALQLVVCSGAYAWWAGWSFGLRFFIGALPILALGIGLCYERIRPWKLARAGAWVAFVLLAIWNQLFIFQYLHGLIDREHDITAEEFFTQKFQLPERFRAEEAFRAARMIYLQGRPDVAINPAREAFAAFPRVEKLGVMAGLVAVRLGDRALGWAAFQHLLARHPEDELYKSGAVLFAAGFPDRLEAIASVVEQRRAAPQIMRDQGLAVEPTGIVVHQPFIQLLEAKLQATYIN